MLDYREVIYEPSRWRILGDKRRKAVEIMSILSKVYSNIIVHGSIARGDVNADSDIDIVVVDPPNPTIIEVTLERRGFRVKWKEIIQATPTYTPKVYLYLDEEGETIVSYPLAKLKPREREFYKWGGECTLEDLKANVRVPGVDKRLMVIEPTSYGHIEYPVTGREGYVARLLGVSQATIEERIRVLTRRREHGRTGVFLKVELRGGESIEEAIERIIVDNPMFRRAITRRI
ncbi:MAG: nucleotidyltransferase domain-containing protein [Acidilobaceae archaeon]